MGDVCQEFEGRQPLEEAIDIYACTHARTLASLETGGLGGKLTCVARSMVFSCSTFSWLCPSPKGRHPNSICGRGVVVGRQVGKPELIDDRRLFLRTLGVGVCYLVKDYPQRPDVHLAGDARRGGAHDEALRGQVPVRLVKGFERAARVGPGHSSIHDHEDARHATHQ